MCLRCWRCINSDLKNTDETSATQTAENGTPIGFKCAISPNLVVKAACLRDLQQDHIADPCFDPYGSITQWIDFIGFMTSGFSTKKREKPLKRQGKLDFLQLITGRS